ncbi:MAG: cob(I)yrinic acid a,c-diamide adenosyltransferase [Planctomycetota bacterium]|jgi:cob(I)alamin adenosyltransferase
MKLYTRTGDDGSTGLFGGDRVAKDHPRVEAYGTVDELNATVGLAAAAVAPGAPAMDRFAAIFAQLQSRLFDLGADLATPADSKHADKVARIEAAHVAEAEAWIDEVDGGNEPMTHFVLPGGSDLAARLHLARTVCRRAERQLVALARSEAITPETIVYLNRVSDLLFAMARRANRELGVGDVSWIPAKND